MHFETISQNSKKILNELRGLIEKGDTAHLKKNDDGWQYRELEFNQTVETLRQRIQEEFRDQGFYMNAPLSH